MPLPLGGSTNHLMRIGFCLVSSSFSDSISVRMLSVLGKVCLDCEREAGDGIKTEVARWFTDDSEVHGFGHWQHENPFTWEAHMAKEPRDVCCTLKLGVFGMTLSPVALKPWISKFIGNAEDVTSSWPWTGRSGYGHSHRQLGSIQQPGAQASPVPGEDPSSHGCHPRCDLRRCQIAACSGSGS